MSERVETLVSQFVRSKKTNGSAAKKNVSRLYLLIGNNTLAFAWLSRRLYSRERSSSLLPKHVLSRMLLNLNGREEARSGAAVRLEMFCNKRDFPVSQFLHIRLPSCVFFLPRIKSTPRPGL
jgi:hypothetical protein